MPRFLPRSCGARRPRPHAGCALPALGRRAPLPSWVKRGPPTTAAGRWAAARDTSAPGRSMPAHG
eukprot:3214800-Alexandrium_andersonii.AAC.1